MNVLRAGLAVAVSGVCLQASAATDYTWQGGGGLFSDTLMWSPNGVPAAGDTAKFATAVPGTVTWSGPVSNNLMIAGALNGNTLVLDLAGNVYTLTNRFYFEGDKAGSFLVIGNGYLTAPTNTCDVKINAGVAPAQLAFASGAVATLDRLSTYRSSVEVQRGAVLTCNNEVKIGDGQAGSESALTVSGGTLALNNHVWMNGGNNSTSTLTITDGYVLASKYFSIGNGGSGTAWGLLNLSGGALETAGNVWLGNSGSTRCVANVTGGVWTNKVDAEVAHGGGATAWLNLSGGEIVMPVSGRNFIVANSGNGHMTTGTVSVTGGQVTATNGISFLLASASNALARFYVGGAGAVLARDFRVGNYRDGRGECVVTGGLLRAVNDFSVGYAAGSSGALLVDGGEVYANNMKVGDVTGGLGTFAMSNGQVRVVGKLYVGASGTGTVTVAGGMLVVSNDVAVGSNWPGWGNVVMTGGGILCSNSVKIGDWGGTGVFDMRGGTVWAPNSVIVGNGNGSTGTLIMTGGRVSTPQNVTLGNNMTKGAWGALYMGGGEIFTSNTLALGSSVTNWGRALLTGGAIEANNMTVGGNGVGDWVQSNGSVTVRANLIQGNGANSTGTVALAGGDLTVRGTLTVGYYGIAALSVSGGTLVVSNGLNCGDATNSYGALTLGGGLVQAKGGTWGNKGLAQVTVSGGSNTFLGSITIGSQTQSVVWVTGGSNTISGDVLVARNSGTSSGRLTVSGGQTFASGNTDVGQLGQGFFEVAGGEYTTRFLRMNTGTAATPVPPQSEIRMTGGRLQVNEACYMPDTATITGKLTLAGGVLAVPVLRQHWGKLHVRFDGGTVQATKAEPDFIRELDKYALTANGLVVDSAGFATGSSLVFPDEAGARGRLVKKGAGVFTLNAASTFTGPAVVQGGALALGASGLITLAGGCEVDGGALLNLSARALDFTLPAGTVSRVDGELRLASGQTLTVASGATLCGTGMLGRVVFESGATLSRSAASGAALLTAAPCVISSGAVIALTGGYTANDLRNGIQVLFGSSLSVAQGGSVAVTLDGVPQEHVALRVAGDVLTAFSYEPGTVISVY